MKKIVVIICIIILCSCNNTAVDYISFKDIGMISIIQFHETLHPDDKAIYIVNGKVKNGVPHSNFLKVKYCDYSAYYTIQNDTTILVLPGWDILENTLGSSKFIALPDFPEADKNSFGYYIDRQKFYMNIENKYLSFNRFKLKMDWK